MIFEGKPYDIAFIGDSIVLQSPEQDIVFEGARTELSQKCKRLAWKDRVIPNKDQIADYENINAIAYCQQHKGVIQTWDI